MISKQFARCLAKISGDGNLYYRYIRYSNTCKDLIDEFIRDVKQEFGQINITKGITNTGTPFVQIHGKQRISKFLSHLPSFKSKDIFVPESIKNADKSIIKEYIRALYDDEGSATLRIFNKTKEWKRSLTLTSNSKKLLIDIKGLLSSRFNIKTNRLVRNKPGAECYVLYITKKEGFIKFRELIGFKHPSKIRKLDLIIESYGNTYSRNRYGFERIKKKLMSLNRSH